MIAARLEGNGRIRWFSIETDEALHTELTPHHGPLPSRYTVFSDPTELRPIFDALLPLARREGWLDADRPVVEGFETVRRAEAKDA